MLESLSCYYFSLPLIVSLNEDFSRFQFWHSLPWGCLSLSMPYLHYSQEDDGGAAMESDDDDVVIGNTTNVMESRDAAEPAPRPNAPSRRVIDASREDPLGLPSRGRPRDKSYKPYYRGKDRRQVKGSKMGAERAKRRYLGELREDEKAEERARRACIKVDKEGNPIVDKRIKRTKRKARTAKK
ncbi:hypothetical protein FOL46_001064 [Perkinsus olseni]|uniref:Uncharacterized protein n=2 Tax=Perkinsus olseni TaxID=32597 RepID=A0A7J6MV96_PEROL|nr:hypothetical protein FOL46_001064 [Perkinsus olseni]